MWCRSHATPHSSRRAAVRACVATACTAVAGPERADQCVAHVQRASRMREHCSDARPTGSHMPSSRTQRTRGSRTRCRRGRMATAKVCRHSLSVPVVMRAIHRVPIRCCAGDRPGCYPAAPARARCGAAAESSGQLPWDRQLRPHAARWRPAGHSGDRIFRTACRRREI